MTEPTNGHGNLEAINRELAGAAVDDGPEFEYQKLPAPREHGPAERAAEIAKQAGVLFDADDIVEVRFVWKTRDKSRPSTSTWHKASELAAQAVPLDEQNRKGWHVYVGANPRKAYGGKSGEDVALARCLFVDFDGGTTPDQALAIIREAGLPTPTLLLSSGGGTHAYWLLTEPVSDLVLWTRSQQRLIQALGSDGSIHDPARVMRLAGFRNLKYTPPTPAVVVSADPELRYELQELMELLPSVPEQTKAPKGNLTEFTSQPTTLDNVRRATAYIDAIPRQSENNGRNSAAYKAAAALQRDYGMSKQEAFPLLAAWNAGNVPPLGDEELQDVLENAGKYGDHPPGEKLNTPAPVNGKHSAASLTPTDGDPQRRALSDMAAELTYGLKQQKPTSLLVQHIGEQLEAIELGIRNDAPKPVGISELIENNPTMAEPVIDGVLRLGETMNIIAPPKTGKSWLIYSLLLSVCLGLRWLRFNCSAGRCLLVDNELHAATLAKRIQAVAKEMGIERREFIAQLDVLSLRGRLMDLPAVAAALEEIPPGTYSLIVFDAFYRGLPDGVSENDNAKMAGLFNLIDQVAARQGAAWCNVHHSSKGSQTDKSVVDTGAGAGAQSRAADAHVVLRAHEEAGLYVLDGVVRSFPPLDPFAIRWEYPRWTIDAMADPALLKGRKTATEQRQDELDKQGVDQILTFLRKGPATERQIRDDTSFGRDRTRKLLCSLCKSGDVETTKVKRRGNETTLYAVPGGLSVAVIEPGHVVRDVVRDDVPDEGSERCGTPLKGDVPPRPARKQQTTSKNRPRGKRAKRQGTNKPQPTKSDSAA